MKIILTFTLGILLLTGCSEVTEIEESIDNEVVEVDEKVETIVEPVVEAEKNTSLNFSQEELEYFKMFTKVSETYTLKMTEIQILLRNHDVDSEQWLSELRGGYMSIAMMNAPLLEMANTNLVPVRFEEIHNNLMQTIYTTTLAGEKIVEGSTGVVNESLLYEGGMLMQEANEYIIEMTNGIDELSTGIHVD